MKILLDTCVWGKAKQEITDAGFDTVWAGDWPNDPGDEEILALARDESRVLVTLDKDFGELAVLKKLPHSGIIRLVDIAAKLQSVVTLNILRKYQPELVSGAIITVSGDRVRIRSRET